MPLLEALARAVRAATLKVARRAPRPACRRRPSCGRSSADRRDRYRITRRYRDRAAAAALPASSRRAGPAAPKDRLNVSGSALASPRRSRRDPGRPAQQPLEDTQDGPSSLPSGPEPARRHQRGGVAGVLGAGRRADHRPGADQPAGAVLHPDERGCGEEGRGARRQAGHLQRQQRSGGAEQRDRDLHRREGRRTRRRRDRHQRHHAGRGGGGRGRHPGGRGRRHPAGRPADRAGRRRQRGGRPGDRRAFPQGHAAAPASSASSAP